MITSLYPVLMSEDVHQAAQFFIEYFQFQETSIQIDILV